MITLLKTFDFDTQPVRVIGQAEAPLFVAVDVCRALTIADHASALRDFNEDEKGVHTVHTLGGPQLMLYVTEAGLFRLIFQSRKETSLKFQRWVCHVVLPQIRREGFYLPADLDFAKYPVAKNFQDIFQWLRGMGIDPGEASNTARSLLWATEGLVRRNKMPRPAQAKAEGVEK